MSVHIYRVELWCEGEIIKDKFYLNKENAAKERDRLQDEYRDKSTFSIEMDTVSLQDVKHITAHIEAT
jgi:hypothetical protein